MADLGWILFGGVSLYALWRGLPNTQCHEHKLLREIIESSRGARLVIDKNNTTILSNSRFDDLCKMPEKSDYECLKSFLGTSHLSDLETLREAALHGVSKSCKIKHEQTPRGPQWYNIAAQPIPDWNGYIHWRIDNVTEEHLQNLIISEEKQKLSDFTDNAPVGFFSADENGRFVFVNATFCRWVGEDIETILRERNVHSYLKNIPQNAAAYDIKDGGGVRQLTETPMVTKSGREFLASIRQTVVHEDDGMVRTRAIVSDLSAEYAIKQALEDSETRFKRFFEESPLGIAIVDIHENVTDCNEALAKLLGKEVSEIENVPYTDMVDKNDWAKAVAFLTRIRKGEVIADPVEVRLWVDHLNDSIACHMFARLVSGGDNVALHFIDLSQQKNLESQFIQSQKMQAVGQLAGGIAHDFNNLLTAIIGFCDLLLLRHKPGDPSFADIQQIKQNSNRAANLVRQLLAFSRQQTLRPQVQDITDILTEVSHLLRRLIGVNIELKLIHGHDLGLVKVDGGQMEQVLVNLSVNARDAMPERGHLTIETHNYHNDAPQTFGEDTMPVGDWVRIDVTDTGTGIPPDVLARIFEPFFTTKDIGKGTGLGLSTVYGIVRQTGGYLGVDSVVGQGTTFSIYLPRAVADDKSESAATTPVMEEKETDLTGSARILLVEDEDAVRTFSMRALTNKGYEVLAAENGDAGLMVFREQTQAIDLLITDVMMPGMDGPTLAKEILTAMPSLKVIFISGYTEEKLKDTLGENIYFLPKPFTLKQLAAKVKDVLGA